MTKDTIIGWAVVIIACLYGAWVIAFTLWLQVEKRRLRDTMLGRRTRPGERT
jgi:hypothetical protein